MWLWLYMWLVGGSFVMIAGDAVVVRSETRAGGTARNRMMTRKGWAWGWSCCLPIDMERAGETGLPHTTTHPPHPAHTHSLHSHFHSHSHSRSLGHLHCHCYLHPHLHRVDVNGDCAWHYLPYSLHPLCLPPSPFSSLSSQSFRARLPPPPQADPPPSPHPPLPLRLPRPSPA